MLQLEQSVDSPEGTNRQMAQDVGGFRDLQGAPPAAEEGQVVVVTADGKGVVLRGQGTPTVGGGERPAGQRANQKRMATVGAVYTVDPYVRTPQDVVAAVQACGLSLESKERVIDLYRFLRHHEEDTARLVAELETATHEIEVKSRRRPASSDGAPGPPARSV